MTSEAPPVGAVLHIGWGEPLDEVTAVVQWWTRDGVVVSYLHDLTQMAGYVWLAAAAVSSMAVAADDDAAVRHLRAVGIRRDAAQVEHDSLASVLAALMASGELVLVQDAEDGSEAGSVGRVLRIDDEVVVLSDIDLDGRETGDELERRLDDIDRVAWDDDYARALTVLNRLG